MIIKISQKTIESLRAQDKIYHARDTELRGFLVRVEKSGYMAYKLEYRNRYGKKQTETIAKVGQITPVQARDRARDLLADIVKEIYPCERRKSTLAIPTMEGFISAHYGPWVKATKKSGDQIIQRLTTTFHEFLKKPLTEINAPTFDRWRGKRLEHVSVATTNRDTERLKSMLSYAVNLEIIKDHPLKKIKLLKTDKQGRVRYLEREEEIKLREYLSNREIKNKEDRASGNEWRIARGKRPLPSICEKTFTDHLQPLVILMLNCGLRKMEVLSLEKKHVDLEKRLLTVVGEKAKSGSTRFIPLNTEAHSALVAWITENPSNSVYVFPSRKGSTHLRDFKGSWKTLLKKTGIKDFRIHDSRHHFASQLIMNNVSLATTRELLGHSSLTMTLRYSHLSDANKAEAVEVLTRRKL